MLGRLTNPARMSCALMFLCLGACATRYEPAPVITDDERNSRYRMSTVNPGPNYDLGQPSRVGQEQNSADFTLKKSKAVTVDETKKLERPVAFASMAADDRYYTVKAGESLNLIALRTGLDVESLAKWNQLSPPYHLNSGQVLRLDMPETLKQSAPRKVDQAVETKLAAVKTKPVIPVKSKVGSSAKVPGRLSGKSKKRAEKGKKKPIFSNNNKNMLMLNFEWPIKGKIKKYFAQTDRKGIEIVGLKGQKIKATEAGKVVYTGQGLIGFGKVLVIKHNEDYLSAYANNGDLFVNEGQRVKKGQDIAKLGASSSKKTFLHFEIRKNGKPVNPLSLLP